MTTTATVQHTPGPWRSEYHGMTSTPRAVAAYPNGGGTVIVAAVSGDYEQAEANAALIAAAPDYYAAAEAIRAHVVAAERLDDGNECVIPADMIRALLEAHRRAYTP